MPTLNAGDFAVDPDARTVRGMLMPWGEQSRRSVSGQPPIVFQRGALSVPADVTVLNANMDHDRYSPFGRFLSTEDTEAGLVASFAIAKTPEGDKFLADYADPTKPKRRLSPEVRDIVRVAGGLFGTALLTGAAFVTEGAFQSAALFAVDDTLTDIIIPGDGSDTVILEPNEGDIAIAATDFPTTVTVTVDGVEPKQYTDNSQEGAAVPEAVTQDGSAAFAAKPRPVSIRDMASALFAANQGNLDDAGHKLLAENNAAALFALSDVKFDGTGGLAGNMTQPQWIGEVWNALTYRQQVLPLFNHRDLTALTINGFRWTTKPTGGDWVGNKADVPSNTLVAAPIAATAARYAVGHDIAREFLDFNVPGFFESYAAAVTEDYAKWADGKVASAAASGATTLAADALTTLPGPTGGTIGSAASAIIDGATVLVTNGALPDFALVAPALWKQMAKQPKSNVLGYLNAALGLEEGDLAGFTIRPSASIAAGKVLVGAREAITVYELPGAPIRIDALDLARGGVDKAAFGYCGVVVNDARGLQLVTAATS